MSLYYGAYRNPLFQGNKDTIMPSCEEARISSHVQVKRQELSDSSYTTLGRGKCMPSGSCVAPSAESHDLQREMVGSVEDTIQKSECSKSLRTGASGDLAGCLVCSIDANISRASGLLSFVFKNSC